MHGYVESNSELNETLSTDGGGSGMVFIFGAPGGTRAHTLSWPSVVAKDTTRVGDWTCWATLQGGCAVRSELKTLTMRKQATGATHVFEALGGEIEVDCDLKKGCIGMVVVGWKDGIREQGRETREPIMSPPHILYLASRHVTRHRRGHIFLSPSFLVSGHV